MHHGFGEGVVVRPHPVVLAPGRQRNHMLHTGAPLRRDDAVDLRHGRRVSGHLPYALDATSPPFLVLDFLLITSSDFTTSCSGILKRLQSES